MRIVYANMLSAICVVAAVVLILHDKHWAWPAALLGLAYMTAHSYKNTDSPPPMGELGRD